MVVAKKGAPTMRRPGDCDHLQTCSLTLAFSDAFTMSLNNIFGCLFGIVAGNTYLCNRSSAANGKE
jgi:hypothetical protein